MPAAVKYGALDSSAVGKETANADDRRPSLPTGRSLAARAALAIGAAAAVGGFAYTAAPPSNNSRASLVEFSTAASASAAASGGRPAVEADVEVDPLSFEASNFYHARDGKPAQDYPWLKGVKLIEPHRETTLSVSSPRDGHEYVWEVRGEGEKGDDLRATASGAETTVILTELNENMITVKEVNPAGDIVRQLQERVMVKYVRREIRTLTDEEREELFDAMYQLWEAKVDGGNGKELYGDDYADIWAINRIHFEAGMNKTCDYFHDGMGFLTTHSMLSNTFEYSLQLVNPKLTLPYWDWTIEELDAERKSVDGEMIIKSPVFQESWFGTADPDDYVVKDGRWAYTESPSMYDGNPGDVIPDVYGRLRSRWSVNPSKYITRGLGQLCDTLITQTFPWPTCALHFAMVTEYHDWSSWVTQVQHEPHGYVHVWIGGLLNCDDTLEKLTHLVGKDNADLIMLIAMSRKGLWEEGFFECKGSAAEGTPVEELYASGQCGCLDYDLTKGDDWQTIYNVMGIASIISEFDDDTKRSVVEAVCGSTIFFGEHFHAGSSPDPSFWPMHPTVERLFMFSVLTGQITSWTWPNNDESSNIYGDACVGHGGSDVFPFGLLEPETDGFEVKTGITGNPKLGNRLTNREVLAALDASVNMLPYVYDTFKWPHCVEAGVDFDDAWGTASSAAD